MSTHFGVHRFSVAISTAYRRPTKTKFLLMPLTDRGKRADRRSSPVTCRRRTLPPAHHFAADDGHDARAEQPSEPAFIGAKCRLGVARGRPAQFVRHTVDGQAQRRSAAAMLLFSRCFSIQQPRRFHRTRLHAKLF